MSFTTSSASSNPASVNSRAQSPAEFLHPLSALYPHVEAMQPPQLYEAIPDWYMEECVGAEYWTNMASEPSSPSASSFSSRPSSPSHRSRAMNKIRRALRSSCSSGSLRSTSSQGSQDPY